MAKPQHASTPRLNALLIGKRTVPSGCQVLNVSQQGMSLRCDPDGRLLTFSSGDSVDIYLAVQHASGHNKFTIPAIVSHVDESVIDVVFHCTDTELAGLIESYRTSETHNLEAKIDHRSANRPHTTIKPAGYTGTASEYTDPGNRTRSSWSFYTGLLVLFGTSLLLLAAYYYISTLNTRLQNLEVITSGHSEELAEVQTQVFSSRLQDGRYASLNARMKALTDAFQSFEKRVSVALIEDGSLVAGEKEQDPGLATRPAETRSNSSVRTLSDPLHTGAGRTVPIAAAPEPVAVPPAVALASTPDSRVAASAASDDTEGLSKPSMKKYPVIETRPEEPHKLPAKTPEPAATGPDTTSETEAAPARTIEAEAGISKPATGNAGGPWIINLLSSPSKSYVEGMQATARSAGIDVRMTSAEVKGRQYWRLQSVGYPSMSAAKLAAAPIKESLEIDDVWIFKR